MTVSLITRAQLYFRTACRKNALSNSLNLLFDFSARNTNQRVKALSPCRVKRIRKPLTVARTSPRRYAAPRVMLFPLRSFSTRARVAENNALRTYMKDGQKTIFQQLRAGDLGQVRDTARELKRINSGSSFEEMSTRLLAFYLLPNEVGKGIVQYTENMLLEACLLPEYKDLLINLLTSFKTNLPDEFPKQEVERFFAKVKNTQSID